MSDIIEGVALWCRDGTVARTRCDAGRQRVRRCPAIGDGGFQLVDRPGTARSRLAARDGCQGVGDPCQRIGIARLRADARSEEHTSELQSLMRISYAVFC